MHGALVCGPMQRVADPDDWLEPLAAFELDLACNGELVDKGVAVNVLGGPLKAFRNFIGELQTFPMARGIEPGDLVTTGTVTRAFPVHDGETWTTRIDGLPLPGMTLSFASAS